jgi:hypothetical protein
MMAKRYFVSAKMNFPLAPDKNKNGVGASQKRQNDLVSPRQEIKMTVRAVKQKLLRTLRELLFFTWGNYWPIVVGVYHFCFCQDQDF